MSRTLLAFLLALMMGCGQTLGTPTDDDDAGDDDAGDDDVGDDDAGDDDLGDDDAGDDDAGDDDLGDDDAGDDDLGDDDAGDDDLGDDDAGDDDLGDDDAAGSCSVAATFSCSGQTLLSGDTATDVFATDVVDSVGCVGFTMSGPEVAVAFTAPSDDTYRINLSGLADDLDLFLLDAAVCDPTACADHSAAGGSSDESITFTAAAGDAFVFLVDGFSGNSSAYSLELECGAASGDDDDAGDDDVGDDDAGDDDTAGPQVCTPAPTLSCSSTTSLSGDTGTDAFATDVVENIGCVSWTMGGPEVAASFTAPDAGDYTVALSGLTADLDLFVLDGDSCDASQCLQHSASGGNTDEAITFTATAGQEFVVLVDGFMTNSSPYNLDLFCDLGGDDDDAGDDDAGDDDTVAASFSPGDLIITEFLANPAGTDDGKEWFEVVNTTAAPIALDGWSILDDGSDSHVITTTKTIGAGATFVFGESLASGLNGGAPVEYEYGGDFTLANGDDEIVLFDPAGNEIDRVAYDMATWPGGNGVSTSLDPGSWTLAGNDVASGWCVSPGGAYGSGGDLGTPDVANPPCPSGPVNADGDPADSTTDCDDTNPAIYPGASEVACDGVDQDCNGADFEPDVDGDGWTSCSDDCNDADPAVYPGATELQGNSVDDDCDGTVDEAPPPTCPNNESEPNDGWTTADNMALNSAWCGTISTGSDVDTFSIPVSSWQRLTITVEAQVNGSPLDPLVRLLDDAGNEILVNDDAGSLTTDSELVAIVVDPGTYHVEVTSATGVGGSNHSYRVFAIADQACTAVEYEPNGSSAYANPGLLGDVICGEVSDSFDLDWYSFYLWPGETITFDVDAWDLGSSLAAQVVLYDGQGNELARQEPFGAGDPDPLVWTATSYGYVYAEVAADWYFINSSGPYLFEVDF